MTPIKLVYLKGSKEMAHNFGLTSLDSRLWNVISPRLKSYTYNGSRYPTFSIRGLKEQGLLKGGL